MSMRVTYCAISWGSRTSPRLLRHVEVIRSPTWWNTSRITRFLRNSGTSLRAMLCSERTFWENRAQRFFSVASKAIWQWTMLVSSSMV